MLHNPIGLILLVFALVCAVLAADGLNPPRCQLGWLSLAFFFLYLVFGK